MRPAVALTDPEALFRLLQRLEPKISVIPDLSGPGIRGGLIVPSSSDPGTSDFMIVADGAPAARAQAEKRWWSEHRATIEQAMENRHVSRITVIFPGAWPSRVYRTGTGRAKARLISAVYHLWVDRLRLHNAAGEVDDAARSELLKRLITAISPEDEKRYTAPSLYPVDKGDQQADEAGRSLLDDSPDPKPGLTVLFGPGGIGKSFFLRRVSSRMAKQSESDPAAGIPAYAELPLLLHTDALETWLSGQGIHLPLVDIRVLIEEGVIVPVLDALDELVRGQAREGSRMFLSRLGQSFGDRARGVLSSRDYYLNLDPLVREELGDRASYLTVGYFNQQGRRRYIQVRTGLTFDHAARWANQLEAQAKEALAGAGDDEIDSLVGHPLFLDAFCEMIRAIPDARRASEAVTFQLRSPNIFGEILDRVLTREHAEKFLPSWRSNGYESQLAGVWKDPFTPDLQRRILRRIVLMVAQRGGKEALKHSAEDPRYARLRHGLFSFSDAEHPLTLKTIITADLGEPETEPHVPESEREAICAHAVDVLVEAVRSHTLADTQPDQPKGLVFATRHRAYFDYFLAEAVLDELIDALAPNHRGLDENFVLWCIEHNIVEHGTQKEAPPFASCLDFVLWHRKALAEAVEATERYLGPDSEDAVFSEELASYVCSLALALLLRHGQQRGEAQLVGFDAASDRQCAISVNADIVPAIKNLSITSCMFPDLIVDNVDMADVEVTDTELRSLRLAGPLKWERVRISALLDELVLGGRAELENCALDLRGTGAHKAQLDLGPDTKITLRGCTLSPELLDRLRELSQNQGTWLQLQDCKAIEAITVESYSPGRKFVNRFVNLSKKHGHPEYGVFREKLKGRSLATSTSLAAALEILARNDVIESANATMLKMTKNAEPNRYSGKAIPGQRTYDEVAEFWDPVVAELNEVFGM